MSASTPQKSIKDFFKPLSEEERAAKDAAIADKNAEARQAKDAKLKELEDLRQKWSLPLLQKTRNNRYTESDPRKRGTTKEEQ